MRSGAGNSAASFLRDLLQVRSVRQGDKIKLLNTIYMKAQT